MCFGSETNEGNDHWKRRRVESETRWGGVVHGRCAAWVVRNSACRCRRTARSGLAAPCDVTCVEIKFRAPHAIGATCFRDCVCAMAWRFHAIDATLSE